MRLKAIVQIVPVAFVVTLLASLTDPVHPTFGAPPTEGLHGVLLHFVNGLWVLGCFAADYPKVVLVLIGLCLLVAGVRIIAAMKPVQKDPQRMFTSGQRQMGFARSGGQCELEGWFWMRCRRPAQHGDHWFPWSKGGTTDMQNFVSGCALCNLSKGAHVPTALQRLRLERRRRAYFPAAVPRRAGNKVTTR